MIVSSRAFTLPLNGVDMLCLIPFADMMNHMRPTQAQISYSEKKNGVIIEACQDIREGEQVFCTYGAKTNSGLFMNYGFIPFENADNEVPIAVPLNIETDPFYDIKMELLHQPLVYRTFALVDDLSAESMQKLFSWLRFVEFDGDASRLYAERTNVISGSKYATFGSDESKAFLAENIAPQSLENETRAWQNLQNLLEKALAKYDTLYLEDQVILENVNLTENERKSVFYRAEEKKILYNLKRLAKITI